MIVLEAKNLRLTYQCNIKQVFYLYRLIRVFNNFLAINVELKTQIANGDPLRQGIIYYLLYYKRKYKENIIDFKKNAPIGSFPALLVSIRGRLVSVHGKSFFSF
jgi:hypothetical protein